MITHAGQEEVSRNLGPNVPLAEASQGGVQQGAGGDRLPTAVKQLIWCLTGDRKKTGGGERHERCEIQNEMSLSLYVYTHIYTYTYIYLLTILPV